MQSLVHFLSSRMGNDFKILNWNPIQKCILVFILFIQIKVLWIIWKAYIFLTPEVQIFVHLSEVRLQLYIEFFEIFVAVLFIVGLLLISKSRKGEVILPYLSVNVFGLTLIFDAYMAGVFSPNTMTNAVCYLFVGFILFNVRVMLSVITSLAITIGVISDQTIKGNLVNAPLFNFETIGTPEYLNGFWMGSIAYFTFPIIIICILLLLLILKQWRERESYIAHLVQFDALTDVYNRRKLTEILQHLDRGKKHAILMLDLDHFKQVNDRYGHLIGDQVLISAAEVLKANIRSTDILGRYGGEEFLIILNDTDEKKARTIAERCITALAEIEHPLTYDSTFNVTASMGIAFLYQGINVKDALNSADIALYQAKAEGRNQIRFSKDILG
ncbi:GGDEF domain-containing protein [Acinetobacter wuhouensis]|uniref:GGDEF domain-containing protein n=1 Tax=Acinetobacter wuhouensis TaxID=1879050 RepID=UPI00083B5440|nr:GGDEF domain-containing protein [Acinetobacter wuhouensis]AXQ22748.1 GGDEF domain-containing protein [Acinetobacter wuhouensis]